MSLLTDQELARICNGWPGNAEKAARAIEQAVLRKLATVGVEPVAFHAQDGIVSVASHIDKDKFLFTTEALAAARAQALKEAAKRIEGPNNNYGAVIRALIGGPT